jgi:hypothetical protein
MEFENGTRVSFEVTGTVISDEKFLEKMADIYGPVAQKMDITVSGRDFTNIMLDNGVVTRIDTTEDDLGLEVQRVKPRYWPPKPDDVWRDDRNESWYVTEMDFGNRKGIRMKHFNNGSEVIRSATVFLQDNVHPYLLIRDGELVDVS